jgi:hypothetical protein
VIERVSDAVAGEFSTGEKPRGAAFAVGNLSLSVVIASSGAIG